MNTGKVVLSVMAGVATGAALGILYAPDKGVNTRRKISEKGEELAGNIRSRVDSLKEDLNTKIGNVKETASDFIDKGRSKVTEHKGDTSQMRI